MFGEYITIPHLLIFLPLIAGLLVFFFQERRNRQAFLFIGNYHYPWHFDLEPGSCKEGRP